MRALTRSTLFCFAIALPTVLGCGWGNDPHGRQALTGTVTFKGELLAEGSIKFLPVEGEGLSTGALIRNGKYSIPSEQGLVPGKYKVLISSLEPTPTPTGAPGSDPAPPAIERLPDEYNRKTNQTVEVKADQENIFNFTIK